MANVFCFVPQAFIEDAMAAWINLADDLRLTQADAKRPDAHTLAGYERQIWKSRLAPEPELVDDMCAHIDGVQNFVRMQNLKAA